jgi:uncharacterized SAM-binding protein YcdF (DUF218 family)
MQHRVALGVQLYNGGAAPLLLLSGGGEPRSEAGIMHDLALQAGVPQMAIECEEQSRNTAENAVNCARLLRRRGLHRIVLVSHRTHLLRARLLFRLAGLTVAGCAGVPPRSAAREVASRLREIAALPRSVFRVLHRLR